MNYRFNEKWDQVIKQDQVSGYHYWLNKKQGEVLIRKSDLSKTHNYKR